MNQNTNQNKRPIKVYDLPTRVFHFFFALLFLGAFGIAKTIDDESQVFIFHMLAGFLMSYVILTRLFWGIVGSEHAQFKNFNLDPTQLIEYFIGLAKGSLKKYVGHNPASSWAALIMMILGIGLGVSGIFMTSGYKSEIEDLHEVLANTFLIVVIFHVLGVALHSMRHRDFIFLSMINGQKYGITEEDSQNSQSSSPQKFQNYTFLGIGYLISIFAMGVFIYSKVDFKSNTINLLGRTLVLGESEESEIENYNKNVIDKKIQILNQKSDEDDDKKEDD